MNKKDAELKSAGKKPLHSPFVAGDTVVHPEQAEAKPEKKKDKKDG